MELNYEELELIKRTLKEFGDTHNLLDLKEYMRDQFGEDWEVDETALYEFGKLRSQDKKTLESALDKVTKLADELYG